MFTLTPPSDSSQSSIKPAPLEAQGFYPTPPASPILPHSSLLQPSDSTTTVALPNIVVPIPLLLDTEHHLPHAAGLRLVTSQSILATLGGNRVLAIEPGSNIWDRMPYSPTTATSIPKTLNKMEEEHVEHVIGGQAPDQFIQGLQRAMRRQKSTEHISSIFVHPPTPEKIVSPTSEQPPSTVSAPTTHPVRPAVPNPVAIVSRESSREGSPVGSPKLHASSLPVSTANGRTIPLQVLPEVRSPPKKSIAMTVDSLPVAVKRGRRSRLFGFTELPDGVPGSTTSSAASSAANSPTRTPPLSQSRWAEHHNTSTTSSSASGSTSTPSTFLPRRHPVRARSEAALMTTQHIAPRRRENGLKLNFDGIVPLPEPAETRSATIPSPYRAKLIRKKSGEILKPALKYGGPLRANGTPVFEPSKPRFESKSCPSTPSCPKYVHFDAQLERVKLFLHDQKPQVVSRDGSPTADTTSEGDEFPFPSTDDEKEAKRILQVSLPNFPTSHPPESDLYLESLFLDDDRRSLKGVVACKNIAFQKWVAVRFTFDFWQTTSEVTATYKESIKGGKYDRFVFSVKLNDMLSRIEEKTLFMAIRYNAEGREIWDSNGGQNYQVLFQKVAPPSTRLQAARNSISMQPGMGKAVGGRTSQWSVTGGNNDDRLADLRAKLDRLTADEPDRVPVSPNSSRHFSFDFASPRKGSGSSTNSSRRGSDLPSPNGSPRKGFTSLDARSSDLPAAGPALAARYDFGSALKTSSKRVSHSPNKQSVDLPEVKTGLLNYGKVNNGHAATEFYSPKFQPSSLGSTDYFLSPTVSATETSASTLPTAIPVPDVQVEGPSPPAEDSRESTPTPTATVPAPAISIPKAVSPQRPVGILQRNATYPTRARFVIGDDSVEVSPNVSPPQLVPSSSTDSIATDTPSESPRSPLDLSFPKWSPSSKSGDSSDEASLASYSSFIEQFCWGGNGITPERRSHSASSLDNYFADSPGLATPRALNPTSSGDNVDNLETPSSTSSFYTSFSGTPTTREDIDSVEHALGGGSHLSSPSPSVVC